MVAGQYPAKGMGSVSPISQCRVFNQIANVVEV